MKQEAPSAAEIQKATDEILAGAEFTTPKQENRLVQWIIDALDGLGQWAADHPEPAKVLMIVLMTVLVVLVIHMIYVTLAELRLAQTAGAKPGRTPSVVVALEGTANNWQEAIEAVRTALRQGNGYQAIWILHRLFVGVLDEKGHLHFTRWKTNADLLAECAPEISEYPLFEHITAHYERVIYAHTPTPIEEITALLDAVVQVQGAND